MQEKYLHLVNFLFYIPEEEHQEVRALLTAYDQKVVEAELNNLSVAEQDVVRHRLCSPRPLETFDVIAKRHGHSRSWAHVREKSSIRALRDRLGPSIVGKKLRDARLPRAWYEYKDEERKRELAELASAPRVDVRTLPLHDFYDEISLSRKTLNGLLKGGIRTIGQLIHTPRSQLLCNPNLNKESLHEIEQALKTIKTAIVDR